jgi:hypothetical protein
MSYCQAEERHVEILGLWVPPINRKSCWKAGRAWRWLYRRALLVDACVTELSSNSDVFDHFPHHHQPPDMVLYLQVNMFTTSMCISMGAGRWTGPRAKNILSVRQSEQQGFASHLYGIIPVISMKVSSLDLCYACGDLWTRNLYSWLMPWLAGWPRHRATRQFMMLASECMMLQAAHCS